MSALVVQVDIQIPCWNCHYKAISLLPMCSSLPYGLEDDRAIVQYIPLFILCKLHYRKIGEEFDIKYTEEKKSDIFYPT